MGRPHHKIDLNQVRRDRDEMGVLDVADVLSCCPFASGPRMKCGKSATRGSSTSGQNLDRQIAAPRSEGCDVIFREKASGKDVKNRPQLEKAIDALGMGDVMVPPEWDRATRSLLDGVHIIERIHTRGALLKVLDKPHLDLTTPIGRGFIAFLSALAEDERQRIVKHANDGRRAARARGATFGRKPKLNEHQRREAIQRLAAGESARAVARTCAVHHATVSRLRAGL
jgi:DNA invertase Pin-like site-specific DNA recombinase